MTGRGGSRASSGPRRAKPRPSTGAGGKGGATPGSAASSGVGTRRAPAVRVKASRRLSSSSKQWLERQLNDPYVGEARARGYRSRAAFKLLQLDERFHLLR